MNKMSKCTVVTIGIAQEARVKLELQNQMDTDKQGGTLN